MSAVSEGGGFEPLAYFERQPSGKVAARRKALRRTGALSALPNEEAGNAPTARLRQQRARGLVQILGLIGSAAAVLSASGHVLAANRLFANLAPSIVRHGRGRARLNDVAADRLVEEALARNVSNGHGGVHAIAIRGSRGKPSAIAHLIALQGNMREVSPGAAALLLIVPVEARAAPGQQLLQRLFGLSPAEARVANALAARQTIRAMAGDFGVSHETVRSQLKTVMAKTGTKRQLDLAVMLANLQFAKA